MRDNRDQYYNDYGRRDEQRHPQWQHQRFEENLEWERRPEYEGDGRRYRARYEESGMREGDYRGSMEDFYNTTYETNTYSGVPRHEEYGLPHGPENDLGHVSRGNPQFYNPDSFERTRYRYSTGYNPNYDNPEEGDLYRNFDSRGNHGYRHDASYGTADEFRDFGDDHYGASRESGRY